MQRMSIQWWMLDTTWAWTLTYPKVSLLPTLAVTDRTLLSFQQIPLENAELLGTPLFSGTVLDLTWAKRCDELTTATDRLASIGAQNALTLLRLSFSSQKVLHLLRCSPLANNPALQTSDSHLWSAISKITNSALSDIPCYRLLCQLYMAAWGCKGCHCSQFLPFWLRQRAPFPSRTIVIVSLSYWHIPWPVPIHVVLSGWSTTHRVLTCWAIVDSEIPGCAGATQWWLLALPIANCGLCLDDEAVRVVVGMRLGLSLCIPHYCYCVTLVIAMVCRMAPGKITRHRVLNDIIWQAFDAAGIPAVRALCTRQTRSQTSRQANLNPMAQWPFVSLGRYSRQPISCFLRWQSSHRCWYRGRYGSTTKTEKYSTLYSAYRFEPTAVDTCKCQLSHVICRHYYYYNNNFFSFLKIPQVVKIPGVKKTKKLQIKTSDGYRSNRSIGRV